MGVLFCRGTCSSTTRSSFRLLGWVYLFSPRYIPAWCRLFNLFLSFFPKQISCKSASHVLGYEAFRKILLLCSGDLLRLRIEEHVWLSIYISLLIKKCALRACLVVSIGKICFFFFWSLSLSLSWLCIRLGVQHFNRNWLLFFWLLDLCACKCCLCLDKVIELWNFNLN